MLFSPLAISVKRSGRGCGGKRLSDSTACESKHLGRIRRRMGAARGRLLLAILDDADGEGRIGISRDVLVAVSVNVLAFVRANGSGCFMESASMEEHMALILWESLLR
jgi:hypothetical protein